ncbi:ATP-binding response regulator [Uliginosibacterium gangwonense]|uniref:ATP-binding response regulator n=1 Tax=Uliginosibacterium gangwonense TaxID=392736 RepID=UPI000368EBA0|nr:response regulator [Uliginosibacterium gangwonense]
METVQGPGDSSIEVTPSTLLLVDDEENILSSLRRLLRKEGYRLLCATSGQAGLEILKQEKVDVIMSDQRMPHMIGTEFLRLTRNLSPDSVRIILSGYTDLESVTAAINEGAVYKFLTKPWDDEILRLSIKEALRHKWIQDENRMLHSMLVEVNEELAQANHLLAERAEFTQDALQNTQSILHYLPIALLGIDSASQIMFSNAAALKLLDGHLALGRPAAETLPEALVEKINQANPERSPLTLGGKPFTVQVQALPHKGQGCIVIIIPEVCHAEHA